MDKLRKNIKHEIAQAMDESYRRNEELWQLIKEMNAQKRRGSNPSPRIRPYSDSVTVNKLPKPNKRMARHERMSDDYEDPESDQRTTHYPTFKTASSFPFPTFSQS